MIPFDTLFTRNVPHIIEKIFFSLDYESYKACLEVSNAWNELLSTESYKKRAKLVYKHEIYRDEMELISKAYYGRAGAIKKLISSGLVDVNCVDERGWTPLHQAAYSSYTILAQILLDGGADPNMESKSGQTPLNVAWWGCKATVKLLLERGANPNCQDSDGMTPLHKSWNTDSVQLLLDGGADPNQKNSFGMTPLHRAARAGREDIVKILLNGGALPDRVNDEGDSPYYLAANATTGIPGRFWLTTNRWSTS